MTIASLVEGALRNEDAEIVRKGVIASHHAQDMSAIPKAIVGGVGNLMQSYPGAFRVAEGVAHGAAAYGLTAGAHHMLSKQSNEVVAAAEGALKGLPGKVQSWGSSLMKDREKGTLLHGVGNFLHTYPATTAYTGTVAAGVAGTAALRHFTKSSSEGLPAHPWRYAAYHGGYIAAADLAAMALYDQFKSREHTFPDQSHGVTSTMHTFPKTAEELKTAILQKVAGYMAESQPRFEDDRPSVLPYVGAGAAAGGLLGEGAVRWINHNRQLDAVTVGEHNAQAARHLQMLRDQAAANLRQHRAVSRREIAQIHLDRDYQAAQKKYPSATLHQLEEAHAAAIEESKAKAQDAIHKTRLALIEGEARHAPLPVPKAMGRLGRYGVPAALAAAGALTAMNSYPG